MKRFYDKEFDKCGTLLCLFLVLLFFIVGLPVAEAAGEALNSSGNRNVHLAVDPVEDGEGYSAILYDNRNGLPTSEANAIAQTSEGFIWIGSYAGLIRYDGNTFERIESKEGILNTRCLYVDSRDRLWIGTNDFGVFLKDGPSIKRVDRDGQLLSVSIRSIAEDSEGLIYIATAAGVATLDAKMNLKMIRDERLFSVTVQEVRPAGDGLVYGVTQTGDIFALRKGELVRYLPHDAFGLDSFLAVLPDDTQPGTVFAATENMVTKSARIYRGTLEDGFAGAQVFDASPLSYVERMECIDGDIWICAGNGIGKLHEGEIRLLKNVPMEKSVGHVMTDYNGNLWFTSTRQSIMKIVPNRFLDYFGQYGLPADVVNTTCILDGKLYIGTDDSGLIVMGNGNRLDSVPLSKAATASGRAIDADDLLEFLKEERIRSVNRDSRGRLWICTWRHQNGLLCYDHGVLTVFTKEDGLMSNQVRTVYECEDGSILAAQPDGLSVIRNQRVTASYGEEEEIVVTSILTLTEGFHHEMILGSDGGGIYIVTGNGVRHIGAGDGLKSEVIMRIKRSRYRDLYWIATGNSIAFMTPDYRVTTVEHFPFSNNYDFYENSSGDLWVLSSNGIYVVSADEMLKNGAISYVFYGSSSGIPFIATSNSFSELTDEGELYIAGVQGVVRTNIETSSITLSETKVALPFVDIDGNLLYPDADGSFVIPYNARRVTLYPYVFNYSLTDPQVSCRLEGFDEEATTVSRSQLTPLSYTNLHAGDYTFELKVFDPVVSGSVEASFRIVKEKLVSDGEFVTLFLDFASLILLFGLLVNTTMYRKRGRLDDKLFFVMIVLIMIHAGSEITSILLEDRLLPFVYETLYAENLLLYTVLGIFPYLFLLYMDFRVYADSAKIRKQKLLYGIPLFLYLILLAVNLSTGWIFSITRDNVRLIGSLYPVIYISHFFYMSLAMLRVYKLSKRMLAVCLILILARAVWYLWFPEAFSAVFLHTMLLVCAHIEMIKQPLLKEGKP